MIKTNLYEKLYTIKQIEKLEKFEEDDSDPDKKLLAKEKKRSDMEKNIVIVGVITSVLVWVFYLKSEIALWV